MNDIITNLHSFLPIYSTDLPFCKKSVDFTPFKVKDAKNITIVLQEENKNLAIKALVELLKSCCKGINPEDLCLADAEYLFLMIRSKSVEENLNLLLKGSPVKVNIFDIKHRNEVAKADIKISSGIFLKIETPKIKDLLKINQFSKKEFLLSSIKQVVTNQEVYNVDTFVPEKIEEFLQNLPLNVLSELEKIKHPELFVTIKNDNDEGEVSGILTFFTFL